jgi:preprotein translocase subunit SecY
VAKLTGFTLAFRTPDLRKKLIFTLGVVALFRFGSTLPAPGVSAPDVRSTTTTASCGRRPRRSLWNSRTETRWNPERPCGIEVS